MASFHVDGAKKSCPSPSRRTTTHRARRAFGGGIVHVPNRHAYRLPVHSHEPSTQTALFDGRGGMYSTGGIRGEDGTGT